ncbi:MAG: hypothetical protein E7646_07970 [Ruminococcaceae bacterium]|nr:hypothetical protein [Oscillospiraceae bacterium]
MYVGENIEVKFLDQIDDEMAQVEIIQSGEVALLRTHGELKLRRDGAIRAWVIQTNYHGKVLLENTYFGKNEIKTYTVQKYLKAINTIFSNPLETIDKDISLLKGMVNRCIKLDQGDWYTTYKLLGRPSYGTMSNYVEESLTVRNALRKKNYDELYTFRDKYSFLLKTVEENLKKRYIKPDVEEETVTEETVAEETVTEETVAEETVAEETEIVEPLSDPQCDQEDTQRPEQIIKEQAAPETNKVGSPHSLFSTALNLILGIAVILFGGYEIIRLVQGNLTGFDIFISVIIISSIGYLAYNIINKKNKK